MQADHSGGAVRGAAGQPGPGLLDDPVGGFDQVVQVVDRADQSAAASPGGCVTDPDLRQRRGLGPGPV